MSHASGPVLCRMCSRLLLTSNMFPTQHAELCVNGNRRQAHYMDTALRRPAAHLSPVLVGVFSRQVCVCDV